MHVLSESFYKVLVFHVLYKSLAGLGAGAGAGVGAGAGAKEEEKKAICTQAVCILWGPRAKRG